MEAYFDLEDPRDLARLDEPMLALEGLPAATIERFLALVAHAHGQLWNSAEPARALGIAETTVSKYLDVLAHTLLGIDDRASLLRNPRVGATWEGVVIEECIRQMGETMTPYF